MVDTWLKRTRDIAEIRNLFEIFPVVALLGPRQSGKTSIAKRLKPNHHFDLENPIDLARLDTPMLTLASCEGLIVIDEVQLKPDLFSLLRYLVDEKKSQKFLILGSASQELIQQSSESLAGRIGYYHLTGIALCDHPDMIEQLWMRGGFPRSLLAKDENASRIWRDNYITTFLQRDIPQLGIQIPASALRRFWVMMSHYHGQILNYSELARSFGTSDVTAKRYVEILNGTFMTRTLQPWFYNTKKRLIKSPKLYLRDSGLFHSLQTIANKKQLLSNPKLGASWEGFAIESACQVINLPDDQFYFWGAHAQGELDLVWQQEGKLWGAEVKYQDAPRMTKSLKTALDELDLEHVYCLYPGKETYPLHQKVTALPLSKIKKLIK